MDQVKFNEAEVSLTGYDALFPQWSGDRMEESMEVQAVKTSGVISVGNGTS